MKKKFLYTILAFSIIISCKNINENETESEKVVKDTSSENIEPIKENDIVNNLKKEHKKIDSDNIKKLTASEHINFDENKNGLKLKFSKINENDFINFKKKFNNKIIIDSSQFRVTDSSLILPTNEKDIELKSTNEDKIYYEGFIKSNKSYVLTNCKIQYCATYLLNKESAKTKLIYSPFDTELEQPVISKDENQILFFSISMDKESFISRYTKNETTGEFDFTKFDSFYTKNWGISEIIWINENTIALKLSDKKDLYLKAIIE